MPEKDGIIFIENLLHLNRRPISGFKLFDKCLHVNDNHFYCLNTMEKLDTSVVGDYKISTKTVAQKLMNSFNINTNKNYDMICNDVQICGCAVAKLNNNILNIIKIENIDFQKSLLKDFVINNGDALKKDLKSLRVIMRQLELLHVAEDICAKTDIIKPKSDNKFIEYPTSIIQNIVNKVR